MHALVVYESMYGNTHEVAEAIAGGLRSEGEVRVVPVADATSETVAWADLVIVGGPTHVHGMTRPQTRLSAQEAAAKPDSGLTLDPDADGPGVREWIRGLHHVGGKPAAAFDTRIDAPALLTGRASSSIASQLQRRGFTLVVQPESFLVDKQTRLVAGETERATQWGVALASTLVPAI